MGRVSRRNPPPPPYRSWFEYNGAQFLETQGIEFSYEDRSFDFDIKSPVYKTRCKECDSKNLITTLKYTPDFFIETKDKIIILEFKGRLMPKDKRIMLGFKASLETGGFKNKYDYRIVFQTDRKVGKSTYTKWAEKQGLTYTVDYDGRLPESWINEFKKV